MDVTGPVGSPKCKTEVKMSTSNNTKCIKETVSQVFGSKFLSGLCAIQVDLSSVVGAHSEKDSNMWCIEGLVSRAPTSDTRGNAARDIQFFSINGRPVELPKISKVIAEAWRNFETVTGDASSKKRPACFLAIYIPSSLFDVNVSPDKREVLLSEETQFHDLLRNSLIELWTIQTQGKFVRDEVHMISSCTKQQNSLTHKRENMLDEQITTQSEKTDMEDYVVVEQTASQNKRRKLQNKHANSDSDVCGMGLSNSSFDSARIVVSQEEAEVTKVALATTDLSDDTKTNNEELALSSSDRKMWNQTKLQFSPAKSSIQKEEIEALNTFEETQQLTQRGQDSNEQLPMSPQVDVTITPRKKSVEKSLFQSDSLECLPKEVTPIEDSIDKESDDENEKDCATILTSKLIMMKSYDTDSKSSQMNRSDEDDNQQGGARPIIWPGFDTSSVIESSRNAMQQYIKRSTRLANARTRLQNEKEVGDIKAMDNTDKNSLYLSKDDFATMSILGQFNLGFILALDTSGHLWILDQHACDEKYNFEKLCKETKVHEQKLIAPLPLELSPSEENCVLEHMEIFENNGFQIDYDSSKPPRHRLSLIAVPHSGSGGDGKKAVQFGPQDVGALCAILGSDGACSSNGYVAGSGTGSSGTGKSGNNAVRRHAGIGNNSVMLPKAVAMFASRACRSSIMVGEALTQRKMEQIVQNLQGLDHPWTCAHGRPTVRHVKDLMDLLLDDESF